MAILAAYIKIMQTYNTCLPQMSTVQCSFICKCLAHLELYGLTSEAIHISLH